jgi:hypothetical protein
MEILRHKLRLFIPYSSDKNAGCSVEAAEEFMVDTFGCYTSYEAVGCWNRLREDVVVFEVFCNKKTLDRAMPKLFKFASRFIKKYGQTAFLFEQDNRRVIVYD